MNQFQTEGYPAFNELDGEIVMVSSKDDAKKMNDFSIQEQKDYPQTVVYSQRLLMKFIGKKIKITLEVLEDGA